MDSHDRALLDSELVNVHGLHRVLVETLKLLDLVVCVFLAGVGEVLEELVLAQVQVSVDVLDVAIGLQDRVVRVLLLLQLEHLVVEVERVVVVEH